MYRSDNDKGAAAAVAAVAAGIATAAAAAAGLVCGVVADWRNCNSAP